METDEQRLAPSNRWGAEVSGWAEHVRQQRLFVRLVPLHVKCYDLFSLGDNDFGRVRRQIQRGRSPELGPCVDRLLHNELVLRKEPLRFAARSSPFSVVVPVDSTCHIATSPECFKRSCCETIDAPQVIHELAQGIVGYHACFRKTSELRTSNGSKRFNSAVHEAIWASITHRRKAVLRRIRPDSATNAERYRGFVPAGGDVRPMLRSGASLRG